MGGKEGKKLEGSAEGSKNNSRKHKKIKTFLDLEKKRQAHCICTITKK
jgi:hypothetical protein